MVDNYLYHIDPSTHFKAGKISDLFIKSVESPTDFASFKFACFDGYWLGWEDNVKNICFGFKFLPQDFADKLINQLSKIFTDVNIDVVKKTPVKIFEKPISDMYKDYSKRIRTGSSIYLFSYNDKEIDKYFDCASYSLQLDFTNNFSWQTNRILGYLIHHIIRMCSALEYWNKGNYEHFFEPIKNPLSYICEMNNNNILGSSSHNVRTLSELPIEISDIYEVNDNINLFEELVSKWLKCDTLKQTGIFLTPKRMKKWGINFYINSWDSCPFVNSPMSNPCIYFLHNETTHPLRDNYNVSLHNESKYGIISYGKSWINYMPRLDEYVEVADKYHKKIDLNYLLRTDPIANKEYIFKYVDTHFPEIKEKLMEALKEKK